MKCYIAYIATCLTRLSCSVFLPADGSLIPDRCDLQCVRRRTERRLKQTSKTLRKEINKAEFYVRYVGLLLFYCYLTRKKSSTHVYMLYLNDICFIHRRYEGVDYKVTRSSLKMSDLEETCGPGTVLIGKKCGMFDINKLHFSILHFPVNLFAAFPLPPPPPNCKINIGFSIILIRVLTTI